jgi:hypothetical protein
MDKLIVSSNHTNTTIKHMSDFLNRDDQEAIYDAVNNGYTIAELSRLYRKPYMWIRWAYRAYKKDIESNKNNKACIS